MLPVCAGMTHLTVTLSRNWDRPENVTVGRSAEGVIQELTRVLLATEEYSSKDPVVMAIMRMTDW